MKGACPQGCVSRPRGGGPRWAAGARRESGTRRGGGSGRRKGPSQTGQGTEEKEGSAEGVAGADAGGKLGGPVVRLRSSACGGLLLKPPGLPLRPGCPICPHTGYRAGLGKGPRRVQTVRVRGRRDRGGGTQEAKTRAAPVAQGVRAPEVGRVGGAALKHPAGLRSCPLPPAVAATCKRVGDSSRVKGLNDSFKGETQLLDRMIPQQRDAQRKRSLQSPARCHFPGALPIGPKTSRKLHAQSPSYIVPG